jgi:hypothetical protein
LEKAVEVGETVLDAANIMETAGTVASVAPASIRQKILTQAPRLSKVLGVATKGAARFSPHATVALQAVDLGRVVFDPSYRKSAIESIGNMSDNPLDSVLGVPTPFLDTKYFNASATSQAMDRASSTLLGLGTAAVASTPWARRAQQKEADQKYNDLKQHTEQWLRDREKARAPKQ